MCGRAGHKMWAGSAELADGGMRVCGALLRTVIGERDLTQCGS